jgi:hypothetical protein
VTNSSPSSVSVDTAIATIHQPAVSRTQAPPIKTGVEMDPRHARGHRRARRKARWVAEADRSPLLERAVPQDIATIMTRRRRRRRFAGGD